MTTTKIPTKSSQAYRLVILTILLFLDQYIYRTASQVISFMEPITHLALTGIVATYIIRRHINLHQNIPKPLRYALLAALWIILYAALLFGIDLYGMTINWLGNSPIFHPVWLLLPLSVSAIAAYALTYHSHTINPIVQRRLKFLAKLTLAGVIFSFIVTVVFPVHPFQMLWMYLGRPPLLMPALIALIGFAAINIWALVVKHRRKTTNKP